MNFTNSPYERMMKEVPHYEKPAPQKAPELSAFFAIDSTAKSRANVLAFSTKRSPACKAFRSQFWRG